MGTTEHEEPRFFFILNKGAKSGGEITYGKINCKAVFITNFLDIHVILCVFDLNK